MTKQFLDVAYEDRDLAKRLGARWDPSVRKWYCTKGSALSKVFAWRAAPKTSGLKTSGQTTSIIAPRASRAPLSSNVRAPQRPETFQLQLAM